MNLPNKLTMLRVLLIPVFMVCAANRWMLAASAAPAQMPPILTRNAVCAAKHRWNPARFTG